GGRTPAGSRGSAGHRPGSGSRRRCRAGGAPPTGTRRRGRTPPRVVPPASGPPRGTRTRPRSRTRSRARRTPPPTPRRQPTRGPAPSVRSDADALGEELAVVGGVAEEDLGGLGALEVEVRVVLPGEPDAAVDLDVLGRRVEVRVRAVGL